MREDDVERVARTLVAKLSELLGDGSDVWDNGGPVNQEMARELARAALAAMQPAPPAEPAPGTVRVRVACFVDDEGDWRAAGSSDSSDSECLRAASAGLNIVRQFSWLTADVPIPQPPEVTASVEEAR